MDYKYAVFDLDGTILDSMKLWRQKEALLMENFIGKKLDDETLCHLETLMFSKAIEEAEKICGRKFDRQHYLEILHADMKKPYSDGTVKLKKNAKLFLSYLKENGIKTAAATATPKELCIPCLDYHGITGLFDTVITVQEVGKSKKFPDIYEIAMKELGGNKENTMFFEDARYCVETLHNNGFRYTVIEDEMQATEIDLIKQFYPKPFVNDFALLID